MDFYCCVKIRTLGFSTCDGFGGGEEFFVYFLFFLPGILYKGRKTNEMNLCLVLWAPSKLLFLQCLLIALKPLLCSCSKTFRQVLGYVNGTLQCIVLFALLHGVLLMWMYRDDALSPSLTLVGLPFNQHAGRPIFSSSFNFFPKIDLPAGYSYVGIRKCTCCIITLLSLFALCWDNFSEALMVFMDFSNWSSCGHG